MGGACVLNWVLSAMHTGVRHYARFPRGGAKVCLDAKTSTWEEEVGQQGAQRQSGLQETLSQTRKEMAPGTKPLPTKPDDNEFTR